MQIDEDVSGEKLVLQTSRIGIVSSQLDSEAPSVDEVIVGSVKRVA